MTTIRVLIPAIPVDNAANRAHARRLGMDWRGWPDPPAGSAELECEHCGGAIMLDPGSQDIRQALTSAGCAPAVACALCAAAATRAAGAAGTAAPPADRELSRLNEGLRRLRTGPREAARIRQILTETDAHGGHRDH